MRCTLILIEFLFFGSRSFDSLTIWKCSVKRPLIDWQILAWMCLTSPLKMSVKCHEYFISWSMWMTNVKHHQIHWQRNGIFFYISNHMLRFIFFFFSFCLYQWLMAHQVSKQCLCYGTHTNEWFDRFIYHLTHKSMSIVLIQKNGSDLIFYASLTYSILSYFNGLIDINNSSRAEQSDLISRVWTIYT